MPSDENGTLYIKEEYKHGEKDGIWKIDRDIIVRTET